MLLLHVPPLVNFPMLQPLMPPQVIFPAFAFVTASVASVDNAVMLRLLMPPDRLEMLGLEVTAVETTHQRLVGVLTTRTSARETGECRGGGWVAYLNKCWLVKVLEQIGHSCRWRAGGRGRYGGLCKIASCLDCAWRSAVAKR
jgi:hypothetical protein